MKLRRGKHTNNCLVASLAMLLDKPYEELESKEGWTIVWPSLPPPNCFRGFHVEELQYDLLSYGLCLVPYYPGISYDPNGLTAIEIDLQLKYDKVMSIFDGLIIGLDAQGSPHAVAWDHKEQLIYDPRGYTASRESIQSECFYACVRSPARIVWPSV